MKLGTIAQEEAACRAAWKNSKATSAWHCHHETLAEALTEPAENRIDYILSYKPANEQALRLRLLRPVKSPSVAPARKAYDEAIASAHAKECPDCPWDGRTIFA